MSRSGYSEDCEDQWALIRWRGAVKSSIKGARGQAFIRELIDALDAMPTKELVSDSLRNECGVCALGAVGLRRGLPMDTLDPEDIETVSKEFGISTAMAREIVYENDEGSWDTEQPEQRWLRMRNWASRWL